MKFYSENTLFLDDYLTENILIYSLDEIYILLFTYYLILNKPTD